MWRAGGLLLSAEPVQDERQQSGARQAVERADHDGAGGWQSVGVCKSGGGRNRDRRMILTGHGAIGAMMRNGDLEVGVVDGGDVVHRHMVDAPTFVYICSRFAIGNRLRYVPEQSVTCSA